MFSLHNQDSWNNETRVSASGERSGLTQERKLGRKGQERPLEVRSGQKAFEILALTTEKLRGETRERHNWIASAYLTRVRKIEKRKEYAVIMTTLSRKFQIVIAKDIREKLELSPKQRLHVMKTGRAV
jgi:hypothetical protein